MNIPKLPSMANFQMDKSFQEKQFLQNQSELNQFIKKNHKNNNYYNEAQQFTGLSTANLSQVHRVKFNDSGIDSKIQGKMLEDQMRLRNLESEYDLQKSKFQDQHNAKTFRKKYPYGKENVRITDDVIEKYRNNNYFDQSQVLKRFQQDAKKRKQQLKSSKRQQFSTNTSPQQSFIAQKQYHRSARKKTSILEREMNKVNEAKRKYILEVQNSSINREKENKKLENIENMLKDMRDQLNQNMSTMTERENERGRQKNFVKWTDITRDRLQKLSELGKQQQSYRKKIPVVVYNDEKTSKNNYFSKIICTDIDSYERKSAIVKPEEFNEVFKIYNLNKKRLDQLSEKIAIKDNKSIY